MLDALQEVVADDLARVGLDLEAGPQLRRVDQGAVAGLVRPGPRRVVGPAPAVLVVEGVAQRAEGLLPAGRRDVEALAGLEVAAGSEDVHMDAAAPLAVLDGRPGVTVGREPGPGRLLELVEHGLDLRVGRPVLRRPGDHAGGVLVVELERVGDGGDGVGVAAADLDAVARLAGGVPLAEQVVGRGLRGAGAAGDELNVHRAARPGSGPAARSPARWRRGGR
ncbi:MAG: hypothetical protein OXH75_27360 [Acidobacteria bacterium]|nr:hypothetical protein [Acidobacteriota bacterium]